jgi:hypothetical protein
MPVPFEQTTAYLVGLDGRPFHDRALVTAATRVLEECADSDGRVVSLAAREETGLPVRDEQRHEVFELLRSFRLGTGI